MLLPGRLVEFVGRNVGGGEPLPPPWVARIKDRQAQEVGGFLHAADAFGKLRIEHRREIGAKQHVHGEARPFPAARTNADVHFLAAEVDHMARRIEPHGDRGMGDLERAQMPGQPVGAERLDGADDQCPLGTRAHGCVSLAQQGKGFGDRGRQALASFGQHDLARAPQEERHADPLFKHLDLIADGRLRHAKFFGSLREAGVACGSLEGTDRRERR